MGYKLVVRLRDFILRTLTGTGNTDALREVFFKRSTNPLWPDGGCGRGGSQISRRVEKHGRLKKKISNAGIYD
jgi:hypothetical protein